MLILSGYYRADTESLLDTQNSLCINSAGHYHLEKLPSFVTDRVLGREDFHLLYVAQGNAFFTIDGVERTAVAGEVAVYFPHEPQYYAYHKKDNPDIYWLHFSGHNARALMNEIGFSASGIYGVGTRNRYIELFDRIIGELQLKREFFLDIANSCLQELLFYFGRSTTEGGKVPSAQVQIIEKTLQHFHSHYSDDFSVKDYAKRMGISTCWFIRSVREYTGQTPLQYLTAVRIRRGQELLENPTLTIGQVADMVGYANPFYFSRVFKKGTGRSPTDYRKEYWNLP